MAFLAGRRVPTHHWGGPAHTLWTPRRLQYKSRLTVSHRFPHQFSSHHYQLPCKRQPWRHGTRQPLGGIVGALQASSGTQRSPAQHYESHPNNTRPTCSMPHTSPGRLAVTKVEFDAMLREGTVKRADGTCSSTDHLVSTKDSGWKTCEDYRALKSRNITDKYSVPHIHDYTKRFSG